MISWLTPYLGNRKCDMELNNIEDFFDAGDCCLNETICEEEIQAPAGWKGQSIYEWVQYPCPENACVKSTNFCIKELLGDGICQDQNNSPYCDHDLGDCCVVNKSLEFCCVCVCRNLKHPLYWLINCPNGPNSCLHHDPNNH